MSSGIPETLIPFRSFHTFILKTLPVIFQYYKLYRANIRTKVNALKAIQTRDEKERSYRVKLAGDYFHLMQEYLAMLEEKAGLVKLGTEKKT